MCCVFTRAKKLGLSATLAWKSHKIMSTLRSGRLSHGGAENDDMRTGWVLIWVLCAMHLANAADALEMSDVSGTPRKIFDGKPTVLVFILHDCPIANAFAPEISRICDAYEKKGVAFYVVHVETDMKTEDAKKHAKDFGYRCPVFIDAKHELVKRAQAKVSPEGAVFAADGTLKYHGRINDLYVDLGKKRHAATTHDLREAIDAVLEGKPVKVAKSEAIGCVIVER